MNSKIILTAFIALFSSVLQAQDHGIIISEKKSGKRVVLFAENTTKDTLNVFFMVISEGYRRSASRPVIKNIPPKSKLPMITMIELMDTPSSYSYELVVNDKEYDINVTIQKEVKDISKLIDGKLVLFTANDCEKCVELVTSLEDKRVSHRVFNIHEDDVLYDQFIALLQKESPDKLKIQFPVIWNKTHHIFGYDTLDKVHRTILD